MHHFQTRVRLLQGMVRKGAFCLRGDGVGAGLDQGLAYCIFFITSSVPCRLQFIVLNLSFLYALLCFLVQEQWAKLLDISLQDKEPSLIRFIGYQVPGKKRKSVRDVPNLSGKVALLHSLSYDGQVRSVEPFDEKRLQVLLDIEEERQTQIRTIASRKGNERPELVGSQLCNVWKKLETCPYGAGWYVCIDNNMNMGLLVLFLVESTSALNTTLIWDCPFQLPFASCIPFVYSWYRHEPLITVCGQCQPEEPFKFQLKEDPSTYCCLHLLYVVDPIDRLIFFL